MKIRFLLLIIFTILAQYLIIPTNGAQESVVIVEKGTSKYQIAQKLAEENILYCPLCFWIIEQTSTLTGASIKAGEYNIEPYSSPISIIYKMIRGDCVIHKFTIPEGITTSQVLDLIKLTPLAGDVRENYNEGDFLPNTYFYNRGMTKQAVLDTAQQAMNNELEKLWPTRNPNIPITNQTELLTMASIIEKETKHDKERPLVASVFYNRLKIGMPLQADPTTIYAITNGKYQLNRPLSKRDLQIKSAYNTYSTRGLPPKPICNPGIESIKAALNPAETKYLYFVANKNGEHSFAEKLNKHNMNVRIYRASQR